ncbi:MAG: aldo/keto reductase [Dysgonamonadaceae bacterium]|nr:aldo/keto reductase [Dysgonamonadaceae bacterium]MDD4729462.1 aldo/keto reductase [Dysgonamonadaceae bacterium]
MNKISLENTDLKVSRINFGGNVLGWTLNEKESFDILDAFVEAGFNFIDTADTYSWWVNGIGGQSETILGRWMNARNNRDSLVIATKVGSQTNEHPKDVSKQHILKSVDASLQRLQTDYIDLYYTHFDDEITPIHETLSAYDEIIKAGKVRYIGASNVSPERLLESFEIAQKDYLPKYVALQTHYNLMERTNYESNYKKIVENYDLAVMPYYSLASGFLSGKYRSEADLGKSVRGSGLKHYLNDKGFAVLDTLDVIAAKHNTLPATVAVAWQLAQPTITASIVSATSKSQLQTLINAPTLKLDGEDLNQLDEVSG